MLNNFKILSIVTISLFTACSNNETNTNTTTAETEQTTASTEATFIKNVDAPTFKELIANGSGIILDVRTPEEVAAGHIENASTVNFYDEDFAQKIQLMDKSKEIYLYCKSGGRSAQAAEILKQNGFNKVYNLDGGIMAWEGNGYETIAEEQQADSKIQQISLDDFKKLIDTKQPVLVDFHTVWCAPCRKMAPIIDELETAYKDKATVVRVDVDKSKEVGKAYEISGVPVFMLFKNGEVIWKHNGLIAKEELEKQLKTQL